MNELTILAPHAPDIPPDFRVVTSGDGAGTYGKCVDNHGEPYWRRLAGPLVPCALARDGANTAWCLILYLIDLDGFWHEVHIPDSMRANDGRGCRALLNSHGARLEPGRDAQRLLDEYLAACNPQERWRLSSKAGWYDNLTFVLPGRTIGTPVETVVFQGSDEARRAFGSSGTLRGWQEQIAELAQGNPVLQLCIATALVGPVLRRCGQPGFCIHLYGHSSAGKTTALRCASSVWGPGANDGNVRSWRLTDNAFEGLAMSRNDSMLALDDLNQANPSTLGHIAYMVGGGQGKARMARAGGIRDIAQWCAAVLSTGETSFMAKIEEGRQRAYAGQEVRVIDVPLDESFPVIVDRHGHADARSLVETLEAASARVYGHAGPAFVECLAGNSEWQSGFAELRECFVDVNCPKDASGQVLRVCKIFGLLSVAAQFANEADILPWDHDEIEAVMAQCFALWLAARGTHTDAELRNGVEKVRRFFQLNHSSRFLPRDDLTGGTRIANCAGYSDRAGDRMVFYVLPNVFRTEICPGYDAPAIMKELIRIGAAEGGPGGAISRRVQLRGVGPVMAYQITSAILGDVAAAGDPSNAEGNGSAALERIRAHRRSI